MIENFKNYSEVFCNTFDGYAAYIYFGSRISVELLKHGANYYLNAIIANKLIEIFALDWLSFNKGKILISASYVVPKFFSSIQDCIQMHMEGYLEIMLYKNIKDISDPNTRVLISNTSKAICFPFNFSILSVDFLGLGLNLYKVLNIARDMGIVFNLHSALLMSTAFSLITIISQVCLVQCANIHDEIKHKTAIEEKNHINGDHNALNKMLELNTKKYFVGILPHVIPIFSMAAANIIVWNFFRASVDISSIGDNEVKLFTVINNTARLIMEVTYTITSIQKLCASYFARSNDLKNFNEKYIKECVK